MKTVNFQANNTEVRKNSKIKSRNKVRRGTDCQHPVRPACLIGYLKKFSRASRGKRLVFAILGGGSWQSYSAYFKWVFVGTIYIPLLRAFSKVALLQLPFSFTINALIST